MGFFPTAPNDGDEIGPNANGTYFKYVAADDKWIIISDLVISDLIYNESLWDGNTDGATKNTIRDKIEAHDALPDVHHAKQHAMDDATQHTSSDVAILDASTTKHGFLKKLDNVSTNFMNGQGNWAEPPGGGIDNIVEDITPQLGGDLDLNAKLIEMNPRPASGVSEGIILSIDTETDVTTLYDCVYVSGDQKVDTADADAIATMPAIGVKVANNKVLTHGVIANSAWGFTAGQVIYVSLTGTLTSTRPSLTGDIVQVMGIALGDDEVLINPSLDWVEIV